MNRYLKSSAWKKFKTIIKNTNNIKHKYIVCVLYSAGLRRSELLNLKLEDIDSKRMVITVKNGSLKNIYLKEN